MILVFEKNKEIEDMFDACFDFKKKFILLLKKNGYSVTSNGFFGVAEEKILNNQRPHLNVYEAKMVAELIGYTNEMLLEAELPYSQREMEFFRASSKFMEMYNDWLEKSPTK